MNDTVSSLSEDHIYRLSEFYKVFTNPTRIKIINKLLERNMSVGELASVLNVSQSSISHQLQIIKSKRLIEMKRKGKLAIYYISDSRAKVILSQLMQANRF